MSIFKRKTKKEEKKAPVSESKPAVAKQEKSEKKDKNAVRSDSRAFKILIKPMVTERASFLAAENKYVFEVDINANKIEIAKAVKDVYGIKPISVNVIRRTGKIVSYGRISGKRKNWKKAIITLPKGKSINIYEGV